MFFVYRLSFIVYRLLFIVSLLFSQIFTYWAGFSPSISTACFSARQQAVRERNERDERNKRGGGKIGGTHHGVHGVHGVLTEGSIFHSPSLLRLKAATSFNMKLL